MVFDKSCPGSRTIREPRPEYINCPECSTEVEIWTDELKATCPGCSNKVYRAQQASCIDWCPHAKECVGPEAYARLRPGLEEELDTAAEPLEILKREHTRVLESLGLFRAAGLCLKLGELAPTSAIRDKGIDHLRKVLDFFDGDVGLHFRREEEVLFPEMEKRLGTEKSPTRMMMAEHAQVWERYNLLKEKLAELEADGQRSGEIAVEVETIGGELEKLLREHIKKENDTLLPLASSLLSKENLQKLGEDLIALNKKAA